MVLRTGSFPVPGTIVSLNLKTMNEEQKQAINAYTHWLFNANSDFVEVAWSHYPIMAKHLRDKLTGIVRRNGEYMSVEALGRFTRELDGENTTVLFEYIIKNHLNKW